MKKLILIPAMIICLILAGCSGASKPADDAITKEILAQFQEFTAIPRPSQHEKAISDYLVKWAKDRNLEVTQDEALNIIIDVPATENMTDKPLIALQAHMDMVFACKDGSDLDPLTTKIITKMDGKYLASDGNTSLGADDGIGLAIALKIAEGKMDHGPLRIIVTTSEENGTPGVNVLKADILKNVSGIINIDCEEEGMVCVSSAEGDYIVFDHVFQTAEPVADSALKITLENLMGGHSGLFIHEGRGNAIRMLAESLKTLSDKGIHYEIASFNGGTAENTIPSNAEVVITVDQKDEAVETIKSFLEGQKEKYKKTDPDMAYAINECDKPAKVVCEADVKAFVGFVTEVPDGVYTWSPDLENFPESSSNLGILKLSDDGVLEAKIFARSSSVSKMAELNSIISETANKHGFLNVKVTKSADAWAYDPNSELLRLTREAYKKCFNKEINVSPVHAGLECGTFAILKPGINIISIGPTILDAHSIDERCDTTTILPVWQLIEEIFKNV